MEGGGESEWGEDNDEEGTERLTETTGTLLMKKEMRERGRSRVTRTTSPTSRGPQTGQH